MKKIIKWLTALLVLVLAAGWVWRYTTMNVWFNSFLKERRTEIYQIGEDVSFNHGYSMRVNEFEIVDYEAYVSAQGLPEPGGIHPEKLALVYVTLENVDSDAEGVMLTDLSLVGVDISLSSNASVLTAINPILEGNYGVHLDKGAKCDLILPFELRQSRFGGGTWRHLDRYSLFLDLPASFEKYRDTSLTTRIQVQ